MKLETASLFQRKDAHVTMKIAYTGLSLPEGKTKYHDPILLALEEQCKPDKVTPYFFECLPDAYEQASAIVMATDSLLDLLILDIEKLENRVENSEDESEKDLLRRCLAHLEGNQPLCDMAMSEDEQPRLVALGPLSLKPTVVVDAVPDDLGELFRAAMEKAGTMFFYTAGKTEVHAWIVDQGTDAVTCASKIHSDLARGFIKAEIVSFDDFQTAHNMQDARSKGLTQLVDKEFVIAPGTILEIRFNV